MTRLELTRTIASPKNFVRFGATRAGDVAAPGAAPSPAPSRLDLPASLPVPGPSMPPIRRGSMVPRPWRGFTRSLGDAALRAFTRLAARLMGYPSAPATAAPRAAWERAAARRRAVLLALVITSSGAATAALAQLLPPHPDAWLRAAQIALFGVLFAWVAAGFFTAAMGLWVVLRGDRHALSAASVGMGPIPAQARTAIIMPICNEQVSTVFAGLRATWESLSATGAAGSFDLFILSDTSDPAIRAAELAAWAQLRIETRAGGADADPKTAGGNIYYRWRQRRVKRKAGNVADFCRRWGRDYRYMVVLDADSVMSGECLVKLVRLMEAKPQIGILQTAPHTCGLATVHARSQQFAARVAGRLFTAGMQFWQLGESHYWGHNAIIRVEPFMRHCALAPLSGRGGLSGEILSHDFVEAALIRRAGYQVWMVLDLAGSYEQQPPNLLEELQRDRRWCQGNLQNARLIAEPGLHGVHRAMLITGAFAYLSAPLWLAFVLVGAALWVLAGPDAGSATMAAAPAAGTAALQAPLHTPLHLAPLWFATSLMLLLPRAMGVVAIVLRREQAAYGGTRQLLRSVLLETGLSILQAPVRMLAHTVFVAVALTGLKLDWRSPPREASNIGWGDAARRFAPVGVVVGLAWAWAYTVQPVAILWLLPMVIPLLLAVPLAVFTGRAGIGQRLRADALLLTPEEHETPGVLQHAWSYALRVAPAREFRDAIDDPWLFDVVRAAMGQRNTGWGARGRARRRLLHGLLHHRDAERLSGPERMRLLSEPQSLVRLRDQLAGAPDSLVPPMPRPGKNPLAPSAKPRRPAPVPVLLQALGAQRLRAGAAPA